MQFDRKIYGADVSKDELVVGGLDGAVQHLPNEAAAIKAWLDQLPSGSIVAMESTGIYHQLLARLAHRAGMHVYVLNAQAMYFYAKGLGTRAKTDRVDCGVITRYVAEHHEKLREWQPCAARYTDIDQMIRRRVVVVTKRDAVRQALRGCKGLSTELRALEEAFNRCVRAIDKKLQALVKADSELASSQRLIATVVGFGPLGSALLATLLARVPLANADALVAFSGIDPTPVDSGRRRGTRRISKHGAAYLRRQWYLAGFTAAHTKALKPMYEALRARGLATTEAILILGRKLLRAAYAVWKTGQPFDLEKFIGKPA
jgi:transposase